MNIFSSSQVSEQFTRCKPLEGERSEVLTRQIIAIKDFCIKVREVLEGNSGKNKMTGL